jgi:hypothetical protein
MQGLCHSWASHQEGSILRDQRHAQVLGGCHELTVVGAAMAGCRLRERQKQIGHHVGVNNDQSRPSRLKV